MKRDFGNHHSTSELIKITLKEGTRSPLYQAILFLFHNLYPNIPKYRSPYARLKRGLLKYQLSNIANILQFLLALRLLKNKILFALCYLN